MDSTITVCVPIVDAEGNGPYTATIGCADNGTASVVVTGNTVCVTFVPTPGYVGTDSLCLVVCDAANACNTSNVVIVVTPPNTPPLVNDTLVYTPMDSTITVCVPIVNAEGNGPYTATISCADNGTVSAVVSGNTVCVTFVPALSYIGTDSLCLVVCDAANACDSSNIVIVVTPTNTPPLVNDTLVYTPMDSTITVCVPIVDVQGNGPYTATIGCANNGTTSAVVTGNIVCVTFVPNAGYIGTDSLCLVICDGAGLCDTSNIVVVVTPPGNLPPVAVPDYATTKIATPVTIPVTLNDYDTDGTINIASVVITQNPLHGTVQTFIDGTNIYTPDAGYVGIDHYIYRIWDNDVIPSSDTALVTIVIEPNKLSVPNGFSPDGDGVNETFVIQGLEAYPDAGLQIYNRWGNLVYEKVPYDNKWEGTSNVGGVLFGSNLPEGTYFYMLDLNNDEKPMSGYVILKR
jgi:gliding motility-associated-like protein